jgi:LL-diaminopimelate aminotransferase
MLAVCLVVLAFVLSVCSAFRLPAANPYVIKALNVARNENFEKLQGGYLFPEIGRRRNAFLAENPDAKLVSLGIGDTTLPIPKHILSGLTAGSEKLGTKEGYTGYGDGEGNNELRKKIADKLYKNVIDSNDVFVSDGAKCDIARLQMLFGQFDKIVYMPCNPANNFFPDITTLPKADVYYICSPNNPTGTAASRQQLTDMVNHAKAMGAFIVFDAAYAPFIRNPGNKIIALVVLELSGARAVSVNRRLVP